MARTHDPRRALPAVDSLLQHPLIRKAGAGCSPDIVTSVVREELKEARQRVSSASKAPAPDELATRVAARLDALGQPAMRRVINATGVILHTGLGRAPLSREAAAAVQQAAGYCALEFDLKTGERGDRQTHVENLLCRLTGAESALVVNNNAAALYLTLNVLGYRREVIVSRGQLIEIGGSFRLPEIMTRTGARLVEVGTTNRTRLSDYRRAITEKTALLLHCHTSNYRIVGFTESVEIEPLAELGREHSIPVVDDIGNGLLWDWSALGLPAEVNARASLAAGADMVLMSGDKVLGGPQAGIILGRQALIEILKRSPLARVLRVEKLQLAALNATLRLFLDWREVPVRVPVWRMLTTPVQHLRVRALRLKERLAPLTDWALLEIRDSEAEAGSGTLPATKIPSVALGCQPRGWSSARWAERLRTANIPVVGTVRQDALWLDLRTVSDEDEDDLVSSVMETLRRPR